MFLSGPRVYDWLFVISSDTFMSCLLMNSQHFISCESPMLQNKSSHNFPKTCLSPHLWSWMLSLVHHLLLLTLEDEPHTWKVVLTGNRISHKKLTASLAILADVPHSKSPQLGQTREVSTQRVRVQSGWIPISVQTETFKVFGPSKRECIEFFLIRSATPENALHVLHRDSASSWPIV